METNEKGMMERCMRAARRYVEEGCGGEWESEIGDGYAAFRDQGELVIARVRLVEEFTELTAMSQGLRRELERKAVEWLEGYSGELGFAIRFDAIEMVVAGSDRALVRHERNAGTFVDDMR